MATETQVIIIGGGVVGLSASLFLASHGISTVLVERHSGTSIHPRARSVNARTMELFRRLYLEDLVREAGASLKATRGMYSGHSLLEVINKNPRSTGERGFPTGLLSQYSPSTGAWVTQDMLEPVLRDVARQRGVDVRYHTDCQGVEQTSDNVTATLKDRDTGAISHVEGTYLIAADGPKSPIRSKLNIPVSGCGTLGHLVNILFRADLKEFVKNREFSLCIIDRPEIFGYFASINNSDRWTFHVAYQPEKGESAEQFTPERCIELVRLASGMPDLEIEIESVLPWEPSVRIADRTKEGRIFFAGDAAHQMPPWAGQGANSGISDAHNLSWKLANVLKGHADQSLLETYEEERLPVGREAARVSILGLDKNGVLSIKIRPAVINGFTQKLYNTSGHAYGYTSKAISPESLFPLGGITWKNWNLHSLIFAIDGRPGRRVPHLWVEDSIGRRISTLDLCGRSMILFVGENGNPWFDAALQVVSSIGSVPLVTYRMAPDGTVKSAKGAFEKAAGVSPTGAILVRPDDFVAWRVRRLPKDPAAELEIAMKRALCLK